MNRFSIRTLTTAAVAVGLASVGAANEKPTGGTRLSNTYDPCWPERYSATARQEVLAPFAQQALNGQIMNQTLWNYHFEPGTDKLTPAGVEKLDSLVRTRPGPDPRVFLQTARDLAVNPDTIDKLVEMRTDLDGKRAAMVARYMATQPRQIPFEVFVHDPTDNSINSTAAGNAFRGSLQGYRGGITGSGVAAQGSGGGTAPGTGQGGGGGGSTGPR